MVGSPRLSKGLRRHIRQEKAAIRRQFDDTPEARDKIRLLVSKYFKPVATPKAEVKVEVPALVPEPAKPAKKLRNTSKKKNLAE